MLDFLQALKAHAGGDISTEEIRRSAICQECPEKEQRFYAEFLDSKIVELNGFVCTRCACPCPLATKIFAKDKKNICPKWK
jgi:hypothetical protein